jgi:hypothetical protein
MARALLVFRKRGQGARHAGRAEALKVRAREVAAMARLADAFEGAVGEIVEAVSSA